MINNYIIILFKNKERYKIIKKYKTSEKALQFFSSKIEESNNVFFDIKTENGKSVEYEIALIEDNPEKKIPIYRTDELGRNIPVELENSKFKISKIEKFNIPEKIYHITKKEKIDSSLIITKFLKGDSLKLVYSLNNKIIIQEDDNYNLFSTKSVGDAHRFLESLRIYMVNNGKNNCLIVKDDSIQQKKYLYKVLSELGYEKKMLYRTTTTHLKDK